MGYLQCLRKWLPRSCDSRVAAACEKGWRIDSPEHYCPRCGRSTGAGGYTDDGCAFCVGKSIAWDSIVRLSAYTTPVDQWIIAMKFARDWSWGPWLGAQLAGVMAGEDSGRSVICPVPLHWWRRTGRGYNQAQLMAGAMACASGMSVAPLLKRVRYTRPQTYLPAGRRHENVRQAFAVRRLDLAGWGVWLVDDVKTTGATLTACTKLLRRAGARRVYVAVAAVADG